MLDSLMQGLRQNGAAKAGSSSTLPLYSPIRAETLDTSPSSPSSSTSDLPLSRAQLASSDMVLKPAQRHAAASPWFSRPSLSRFLADFTLGFADGLTVPFALTAGLSSLGQTDTVIYAGMAEICAGSISMGIGGYLSARGEAKSVETGPGPVQDEGEDGQIDEKGVHSVGRYLAPLDLPPELLDLVREHIDARADVAAALERQLLQEKDETEDDGLPSPVISGMSVALGYLIGGSLPLFPYFVVSHVGDGLFWSFAVCIIALFSFGFIKDFALHMLKHKEEVWVKEKDFSRMGWRWADVRRSSWEGTQMVLLGSMAALAAVLCVRLFDGMGYAGDVPQSQP